MPGCLIRQLTIVGAAREVAPSCDPCRVKPITIIDTIRRTADTVGV